MGTQMVFKRYEIKYLLDRKQKEKIGKAMELCMALDGYLQADPQIPGKANL